MTFHKKQNAPAWNKAVPQTARRGLFLQLTQFFRALGGCGDGVDKHRTQPVRFEFGDRGDGSAAGRGHLVAQDGRVLAGFQHELRCADSKNVAE